MNICVSIIKGGVGKSTVTSLLTEWLLHKNKTVRVVDADPNENIREWLDFCKDDGRIISSEPADFTVIDTPGRSGSGHKFLLNSDIILSPFQLLQADVSVAISWFLTLHPRIQQRVCFIPNRVFALGASDQYNGLGQIEEIIAREKAGFLLPGLIDRVSIYPMLLEGSPLNFFNWVFSGKLKRKQPSLLKAQSESNLLFSTVFDLFNVEV